MEEIQLLKQQNNEKQKQCKLLQRENEQLKKTNSRIKRAQRTFRNEFDKTSASLEDHAENLREEIDRSLEENEALRKENWRLNDEKELLK